MLSKVVGSVARGEGFYDAVALRYKELWRVEQLSRDAKSLLSTRPVFHHWDATTCGPVFVSCLALVLLHELEERLARRHTAQRVSGLGVLSRVRASHGA